MKAPRRRKGDTLGYRIRHIKIIILAVIGLAVIACTLPFGLRVSFSEPTLTPTETQVAEEEVTELPPTEPPTDTPVPTPTDTPTPSKPPSATPFPSPTPLDIESGTAATVPPTQETTTYTPVPPDTPPRVGRFDVYLGAPDDNNVQLLRWVETRTGYPVTEIPIRTDDGKAVRAGQYIYFHAPGTRHPHRVNTAGAVQPLSFADPPAGTSFYQLAPSVNGDYLAWLSVAADGVSYTINMSFWDGSGLRQVTNDMLEPGMSIRLLRITDNGRFVFYERRPASVTHQTIFNAYYDLYMFDTMTGTEIHLPDEPACGESLVCDAYVSRDGKVIVRTLPASTAGAPVVVTNLDANVVIARFEPESIPTGAAYELGYPYFTPGGSLIFMEAYGPPGLESYLLALGDLVTGEQRLVASFGNERHRPLGWASDGVTLLTTREPGVYDTWQINIETGAFRQISEMMFLGHIKEPPTP